MLYEESCRGSHYKKICSKGRLGAKYWDDWDRLGIKDKNKWTNDYINSEF